VLDSGDIGTGARKIGYLSGAYKKLGNEFTGMLTGKGVNWGGSFIPPESTGYGQVYFVEHVSFFCAFLLSDKWFIFDFSFLLHQMIAKACPENSLDKPTTLVAISSSGNVVQHTALKLIELGATALSLSDSKGSLISKKGLTKEFVQKIAHIKLLGSSLDTL
jgi:glutamate dehydrogenase (NADP+)